MLQEESCKKLAAMITKAFGQSQMREFAKNCNIDLSRQIKLDEQDIVIRERLEQRVGTMNPKMPPRAVEGHMYDEAEQNEMWDPNGNGEKYMGPPPDHHLTMNKTRTNTTSIQKAPTQITAQQTLISKKTTMAQMAQQQTLQPPQSQLNKNFNSQLSAIPKTQISRQFTRLNTGKSFTDIPVNKTALSRIERSQILESARPMSAVAELPKKKQPQFIKIGDIILLTLSINIFQADIEANETRLREEQDFDSNKKAARDNFNSVNLQKITDTPEFRYKGVVYCEGINNLALQVLPQRTEENTKNALSQFQKCLFQVEPKSQIHYKVLLETKLKERDTVYETRKKTAEKNDFQALSKIDLQLTSLKNDIEELEKQKALEDANNQYMMNQQLGKKIQYGDDIQLKHIFTNKYLSIEASEMSSFNGAVKVNIQSLSRNAWIKLIPSINQASFGSEMLINSKDAKRFNLLIGGHINVKDSFYLMNIQESTQQKYFLHIDKTKAATRDGMEATLEMDAGLSQTKFNSKMFLSYHERDPKTIYSGDVVRLYHVQSGCNMQTQPRLSGTRAMFSPYPNFLKAEIQEMKDTEEEWEGDFKNLNYAAKEEESYDFDDSNEDLKDQKNEKENEVKQSKNLFLETETRAQSLTDSCFEIQNVNSFVGGAIEIGQSFRLKQTVTEQFVGLDPESLYLTLREDPLQQPSTIFQCVSNQNDSGSLQNGSLVYLKTFKETYVQIFQGLSDEIETLFKYKDFSAYEFYNTQARTSTVSLIAGAKQNKCEDSHDNMIFRLEKVDPREARISYECNSYMKQICDFWEVLNMWAVVKNNRAEAIHTLCYDGDSAVMNEDDLTFAAGRLLEVIQRMNNLLESTQAKDEKTFKNIQTSLAEQKIIECILYLIELIYYKTVPPEFRHKPFKPDRLVKPKIFSLEDESFNPYSIAKDKLDDLNLTLLKSLMLIIRYNPPNCEKLSRFSDTLFNQFRRAPNPFADQLEGELTKKIFCHIYKNAQYLHNDRASVIRSVEGINQNMPEVVTKTHQVSRWINLLETVFYKDDYDQNIMMQVRYYKIMTSFCKTNDKRKFKYIYQIQIIDKIFHEQQNVPLWLGVQRRADKTWRPLVYFERLQKEDQQEFFGMNPYLQNSSGNYTSQDNDRKFDVVFNLDDLTLKYDDNPNQIGPYFDYIAAIIQMYAAMCGGRNREAITFLRQRIGASDQFLLDQAESLQRQPVGITQRLKPAYLDLARVLILDHQPFNDYSQMHSNRVFFWSQLPESELHTTIYRWEKHKYGDDDDSYGTEPQQIRKSTLRIRRIITDFLEFGPQELIEFLYSSEKKQYTETMVNPRLSQLNSYIECAIALLTSENTDTCFIQTMLDIAVQILLGVSCVDFIDLFVDSWFYKLMRVVHKVPECRVKEEKLICQALEILQVISDHRLTQQLLHFLKSFQDFEEAGTFSHINFDTKQMDQIFKNLFSIQQFNCDTKALQVLFLMLDPKRKIIVDLFEEQQYEETKMRKHKMRALQAIPPKVGAESHRTNTARDSEGNVADQSFLQSQRTARMKLGAANVKLDDLTATAPTKKPLEEDQDIQTQLEELSKPEASKKQALTNLDLPLDEYLLYFSLMRIFSRKVPAKALKIVYCSGRQRHLLLDEASKIELLVSEQDRNNYKTLYFLKERLVQVSQRLVQEEFTYLLYKIGQTEQKNEKIVDCSNMLRQLTTILQDQKKKLQRIKVQNIVRQIGFVDFVINNILKTLYYDRTLHKTLFDSAMEFFFLFTYHNPQTQKMMRPHLAYLAELVKWDINSGQVIAQIVQSEKLSTYGMKFHMFIIRKLVVEKQYKPQLFDYLTVVSQNEPVLQTFFLSQIVPDPVFRNKLYMKKHNERQKIDMIKELVRKRLIFGKGEEAEVANDVQRVELHISIVTFLAQCGIKNTYGQMQIRRLVELERLVDALLAQSVPFLLKAQYFRLFYSGFLQQIGNEFSLKINWAKFLQIVRFVVLYDLEQFYEYFNGLVIEYPPDKGESAMNDPEWKRSKARVLTELERQSKETSDKVNAKKTFKQKSADKEIRQSLSPLNEGSRPYPFLDQKNMIEYWQYLCSDNKQTGQSEGLLIFIRDMYQTLMKKQDQWTQELRDSSELIYKALLSMTDTLDNIREMYRAYLINLDSIMLALSEATHAIPSKTQKINTIGGDESDYEEQKLQDDKLEKIMIITRDYIISKNKTIREGFKIKSLTQDVLVHPYFMKRKIKDICGNDVTFEEIEMMVRKLMSDTQRKQQLQSVVGTELGQPGHIRTRHLAQLHEKMTKQFRDVLALPPPDLSDAAQYKSDESQMFNFKEFEQLLKSKLQKAGFKPPIMRRERVTEEENFTMVMKEKHLSHGFQSDLQHFIKCYFEFLHRFSDADEVQDMAKKILQKFNLLFIQGSKQNEHSIELVEYTKLKQFIKNLVRVLQIREPGEPDLLQEQIQRMATDPNLLPKPHMIDRNHFLLALITQIVAQLRPNYFEPEIRPAANQRYILLQRVMDQCGMLSAAYSFIDPRQPDQIISQAFRLITALIENENKHVLKSLFNLFKDDSFKFLSILKFRINECIDRILNIQKLKPSPPQKTMRQQVYDQLSEVSEPHLISQPFYLPEAFSIENKLQQEDLSTQIAELLYILELIQNLCNGMPEFQELLTSQEKSEQVDLVQVIGESLIRVTERVKSLVYSSFKLGQGVQELLRTLTMMADGQPLIQQKFAKWRGLQKTFNFFIEQNFVYYSADSLLSRNKIQLMSLALNLLTLCVQTEENLQSVILEINMNNLKSQLITIFKFKIGGTPHRDHVFNTNKVCTHKGLCLKNEYCFFQALVSFDTLTFKCAYDIFFVLQQANLLLPIEKLGKIRYNAETGNLFLMGRKRFINQLYWESFERIQEQIELKKQEVTGDENSDTREAKELNALLELVFITQNHVKIERRYYKQQKEADYGEQQAEQLFAGIDRQPKLAEKDKEKNELAKLLSSQNEFVKEEEEEFQFEEIFVQMIGKNVKKPNFFRRYCCMRVIKASAGERLLRALLCCSWLHSLRKQKVTYERPEERIKLLFEKRKLVQNAEGRIKIDQWLQNRQIEIARKRQYTGPFTGSLTKQMLQTTTYLFDQFKYDYVYRYMLNQMACIEVENNHKIIKTLFQIPTYCKYITARDEQRILADLTYKHSDSNQAKMTAFIQVMPEIKLRMLQNQALARVSPMLYQISQQSKLLTKSILIATIIVNLVFFISYTYRFDPPKPVLVEKDRMEWLKETVNLKGFKRYEPPKQIIYDPWEIRMKFPQIGFLLDLMTIFNAVVALLAFILKQLTMSFNKQFRFRTNDLKEDTFTTGSLATMLPQTYQNTQQVMQSQTYNYLMNTLSDIQQVKHLIIIGFTGIGLVRQDTTYPYLLLFLIVSELEIMQQFLWMLYCRARGLITLVCLTCSIVFIAAYQRFINRQCLEVTECYSDMVRGIIDLPNHGWTEFTLFLVIVVLLMNLFLGLIVDSISEVRQQHQAIKTQLETRCFVCDLSQQDFEFANLDFKKHVQEEHNPIAYLFYMMWVSDQKNDASSTKITRDVKHNIDNIQTSFMPWRRCLSMQDKKLKDAEKLRQQHQEAKAQKAKEAQQK